MISFLSGNLSDYNFKNCTFLHEVYIGNMDKDIAFTHNCDFKKSLKSKGGKFNLFFENSNIEELNFEDAIFGDEEKTKSKKGKVRFHNCTLINVNFRNATFNRLVDFWSSTFYKPTTFYKTDFLSTTVFSNVKFVENVLFTYSLFKEKTIFGRTKFYEGLDLSQAIIAGDLKLFDLYFKLNSYKAEYIGNNDDKFQDYIDNKHLIPKINKVSTFQILKNQFSDNGNHIDEIIMRKKEKQAFSELTHSREKDSNWKQSTRGDQFILWLNRRSNNYKSDFRNGIVFTVTVAVFFLLLTFITTGEFWRRICVCCETDSTIISYTLMTYIKFLNPVHKIDYINDLNPLFGIPYVFDFLGRIFVGYGIYQTVQAFRKYK